MEECHIPLICFFLLESTEEASRLAMLSWPLGPYLQKENCRWLNANDNSTSIWLGSLLRRQTIQELCTHIITYLFTSIYHCFIFDWSWLFTCFGVPFCFYRYLKTDILILLTLPGECKPGALQFAQCPRFEAIPLTLNEHRVEHKPVWLLQTFVQWTASAEMITKKKNV